MQQTVLFDDCGESGVSAPHVRMRLHGGGTGVDRLLWWASHSPSSTFLGQAQSVKKLPLTFNGAYFSWKKYLGASGSTGAGLSMLGANAGELGPEPTCGGT